MHSAAPAPKARRRLGLGPHRPTGQGEPGELADARHRVHQSSPQVLISIVADELQGLLPNLSLLSLFHTRQHSQASILIVFLTQHTVRDAPPVEGPE